MDFYERVPKDLEKNIEFRLDLRRRAAVDLKFRSAMMTACRHDVLFFLNAFCFLYEPRAVVRDGKEMPHVIPFITWPHQDDVIRQVVPSLGTRDIGVEKSRGEGMSWIGVLLALHGWLFGRDVTIGMCSSTEEKADKPGDRGSLMGKLDWELTQLPKWMVGEKDVDWKRNLSDHTLQRFANDSLIVTHAATAGTGRGHRYLWFLLDELGEWRRGDDEAVLASLQFATDSRLFVSTAAGASGAFYELMHEPSSMVRVVMDWKRNISRNRGLYVMDGGVPSALDPVDNPLPAEYNPPSPAVLAMFSRLRRRGFALEKGPRSPWYDKECDKSRATPFTIAQELDRDYGGSTYRIFGHEFFARAEASVRPPVLCGVVTYHPETLEPDFEVTKDGPVLLWLPLSQTHQPPQHLYAAGVDVASGRAGSYTSNSALEIFDIYTMEQVLEYACNSIEPADFADLCIAICKLFNNAYLAWEHNGPGGAFTNRVISRRYANCYRRTVLSQRGRKKSKELGWWTERRTKEVMFADLSKSVRSDELRLRSDWLVKECGQYVRGKDGEIAHSQQANTEDFSSRGQSHGDRVIAAAVCLQGIRDRPLAAGFAEKPDGIMDDPPVNTMAWREKQYQDAHKRTNDGWDRRGLGRSLCA